MLQSLWQKSLNCSKYILVALISAGLTYFLVSKEPVKPAEMSVIKETVKQETITEVVAKPKEKDTDADLVINTKNSVKVSMNGKEVELKPEKKESFDYGKDYLQFQQSNTYSLNIENKPLEPTMGLGIGVSSNKKLTGIASARIKKTPYHIWIMSDGKTTAGGIMFSTNYK